MTPLLRNVFAVIAGFVVGSVVNMGIVMISGSIVPPPPGADMTTAEGLKAAMPLLGPQHFLMPLLAHALGTFAGAFTAAKIALSRPAAFAYGIGGLFFLGGIAACFMIPAPLWFKAADLLLAYFPMAALALKLAGRKG